MNKNQIAITLRAAARKLEAAGKPPPDVDAIVEKLAEMTDRNYHTEAVIELAKWLGSKRALKATKGVQMIHDAMGSMPSEVSQFRFWLLKSLWEEAEKKYGKDVADQIKMAF